MRKEVLEKKLLRYQAKRDELMKRGLEAETADEVRSINAQIADLNEEIGDIQDEIRSFDEEPAKPESAKLVNGNLGQSFTVSEKRENVEPTSTMEYRQAFMKYIQHGTEIPVNVRGGVAISTADTGAAIPLTIMNEVINTVRLRYGNLYSKVMKTNVKGGIEYPIGALKATFKWINETTVSPRQKLDPLAKVSFGYHPAEIRIAQTFLSDILTLDAFEAKVAEVITVAYLEAMDYGIVNGTGNGQMLGILNDPRVLATGNVVEMTAADIGNWAAWRKKFFAKLPLGYRYGEFIFPIATVDAYLETMADANNNPVFRQATGLDVNDGDARNPNGRFFGREISLVEPDIIPDFDSANVGDVIGVFWQPDEYAINENFGFTMRRYFDEETNEWVDKALVVVDGKVLNPNGIYLIKKK